MRQNRGMLTTQALKKVPNNKGLFGVTLFNSDAQKENTTLKQTIAELELQLKTNEEKAKQIESDLVSSNELLQKKAKESTDRYNEIERKFNSAIAEKEAGFEIIRAKMQEEINKLTESRDVLQKDKMEYIITSEAERTKCSQYLEKLMVLEKKLPILEKEASNNKILADSS